MVDKVINVRCLFFWGFAFYFGFCFVCDFFDGFGRRCCSHRPGYPCTDVRMAMNAMETRIKTASNLTAVVSSPKYEGMLAMVT